MEGNNKDDDSNDNGNNYVINGNYHWIEWLLRGQVLSYPLYTYYLI